MSPARLSLVVIAANEERHIGECLRSAAGLGTTVGEIVLVDDYSRDGTVPAARQALQAWRQPPRLRLFRRRYDGQARQTNFAMEQAECDWLLLLDCDERLSAALRAEVARRLAAPGERVGFYFPRRNIVFGRWLRHGGNYPDYNHARLVRRGCARFQDRAVHAHLELSGAAGYGAAPLIHHSYPGLAAYFDKFNRYTSAEAADMAAAGRRYSCTRMWAESLGHLARRGLGGAAYLDGAPGLTYLALGFAYDLARHLKLRELTRIPAPEMAWPRPHEVKA